MNAKNNIPFAGGSIKEQRPQGLSVPLHAQQNWLPLDADARRLNDCLNFSVDASGTNSPLMMVLAAEAIRRKHTLHEAAIELRVTRGLLWQLARRIRGTQNIGNDMTTLFATYLQIPRVVVHLLAGALSSSQVQHAIGGPAGFAADTLDRADRAFVGALQVFAEAQSDYKAAKESARAAMERDGLL